MANQIIVTKDHAVQVSVEPTPQVQVSYSRSAILSITTVDHANTANTVTNNAQPNITSVGTLTGLNVNGNVTANFFLGNLVGNISGNFTVPGSNTAILYNETGNAGASDAFKFDYASNTVNLIGNLYASNLHGEGGNLSNIQAGNVIGNIANANFASFANVANIANTSNSVNVANVVGIGNIAVLNLDGNAGNILYGNGVFSTVPNVSNVANANFANFAGNAFSVSGSNVSGVVANANYSAYAGQANTANLATYATTANSVSVANVVGIGNIATTNYDGNASNILYGNGGFYALPTISNVGNANFANYAGNAFSVSGSNVVGQVANANYSLYSNIANTANLATFATTANSVAGANVSGTVANANYALYANIASTANTVAGANVTGVVANANYATYAGTAYSVSGSNVSGEVANANYATYAGTAYSVNGSNVTGYVANSNHAIVSDSANSVTVANVVGIGNIATTNYDGNANHVLYGNGAWANIPTVSNVANANYANFAGTVVTNAQPNITSVGTLGNLSVTGNIDTGNLTVNNVMTGKQFKAAMGNDPDAYNGYSYDGAGNILVGMYSDGSGDVNFYAGNSKSMHINNTGVDLYGNVNVNNSYNLPFSDGTTNQAIVTDGAGSLSFATINNIANANYAAFSNVANTANSVAGANVTGIVANANYAAYAGNVTSTVANANFAAYAGNVTVASQGNITTVGNLLTLNVINATANSTQFLFTPNGTNVGLAGQNTASFVINQFNTQPSISNQVLNMQFTAARGNATNPSNVANADYIGSMSWNTWNTNTYIRNARVTVLAPQGGNTAQWGSNVAWGAGSYFINTGNPLGNITSNTSLTTQNIFGMTPFGSLSLTPGTPGPNAAVQNALTLVSYGANTDGAGGIVNRIVFQRARGNRDSNQTVQNGDGVGGFFTTAYGNGAFSTSGAASMYMQVDTAYGNITSTFVPIRLNFSTQSSNGTNYTTAFLPDGNVTFPSGGAVISSYYYGDGSNLSNISGSNITGAVNLANYATTANSVAGANVSGQVGNALIAGTVYTNAQPNITSTGTLTGLTVSGNANISNLQLNQFQETVYSYGSASGTITPDFNNGSIQQLTLTGNITMNSLGNAIAGRSMTLILTQDGTGNRTLTSTMKFAGGSKTLSTAASAIDIISVFYDGSTYYSVLSKGYA